MPSQQRKLDTILEEDEAEVKRCKLTPEEWKIVFEVDEHEYRAIQMRSHVAIDELFGLVFDYEAGQIYSLLANIVFLQCEDDTSITGMSRKTLLKMQQIIQYFNYFSLEDLLSQYSCLIPAELTELINQVSQVFNIECLPGVIRLMLCCLPLSKYKCLAMLALFVKRFQKQGSLKLASSILKLRPEVSSLLVNNWEFIFLLPSHQ